MNIRVLKKDQVEDALDVAILFIAYTGKFLSKAMIECEPYHDIKEDSFSVRLDYKNDKIIFYDSEFKNNKLIKVIKKEITPDLEEYIDYLKWFVGLYKLKP